MWWCWWSGLVVRHRDITMRNALCDNFDWRTEQRFNMEYVGTCWILFIYRAFIVEVFDAQLLAILALPSLLSTARDKSDWRPGGSRHFAEISYRMIACAVCVCVRQIILRRYYVDARPYRKLLSVYFAVFRQFRSIPTYVCAVSLPKYIIFARNANLGFHRLTTRWPICTCV